MSRAGTLATAGVVATLGAVVAESDQTRGEPMTDLSKIFMHTTAEDYPLGTKLRDISPFVACSTGVVTAENSPPGLTRSFETSIAKGSEGWGSWGFAIESGLPPLVSGDEIWFRTAVFFPHDFVFQSHHGSFKTFRIGRRVNGQNAGYLDWQIKNDRNWQSNIEFSDSVGWVQHGGGQVVPGEWQFFEVYARLHKTHGQMRIWRNGELFGERSGVDTMPHGANMDRILWLTYVNGGAYRTQSMQFTEFGLAVHSANRDDREHMARDAAGNFLIGTAVKGQDGGQPPVEPPVEPPEPTDPKATLEIPGTKVVVTADAVMVQTDKNLVVLDG